MGIHIGCIQDDRKKGKQFNVKLSRYKKEIAKLKADIIDGDYWAGTTIRTLEEQVIIKDKENKVLNKAFFLTCRHINSLESKMIIKNGDWRTNTTTIDTIMKYYLEQARGIK